MATVSFLGLDAKNKKQNPTFLLALSLSLLSSPFGTIMLSCYFMCNGSFWLPQASSSDWSSRPGSLSCPISPSPSEAYGKKALLAGAQDAVFLSAAYLLTGQRLLFVQEGHQLQFIIDCSLPSNVSKARNILFLSSSTFWRRHVPCLFRSGNAELNSVICYRHNLNSELCNYRALSMGHLQALC